MVDSAISKLVTYALRTGLIEECEALWAVNQILDALKLDSYTDPGEGWGEIDLAEVLDELLVQTPLGRLGTPADIAHAVAFFASEKSSFITGQVLTADGGFIL